jgi:hypothetical protein
MRGVRLTKSELEFLRAALVVTRTAKEEKARTSIMAKLDEATAATAPGIAPGPLQDALMLNSRGKVVRVEANGYGRISRQATQLGATVAQATLLGNWIASQGWLQGPLTIFTVLAKWPDWLARAKATAPPDGIEEGLAANGATPAARTTKKAPGLGAPKTSG